MSVNSGVNASPVVGGKPAG